GQEHRLALLLHAIGRDGAMTVVPDGQVTSRSNRAEICRGTLTEWIGNESGGVEHGCTIAVRPAQQMEGDLTLAFATGGDVRAELQRSDEVLFTSSDPMHRPVLRYGDLRVRDADGRDLAARFVVRDDAIEIHVDDQAARYPLDIDPLAR